MRTRVPLRFFLLTALFVACGSTTGPEGAPATSGALDADAAAPRASTGDPPTTTNPDVPDASAPEAAATAPAGPSRYDGDGPEAFDWLTAHTQNGTRGIDLTVAMPRTPGPKPVVHISSGSSQQGAAYTDYAERLASYGIVTILHDDLGALAPTSDVVADVVHVVATWLPSAYPGELDLGRVGLVGHSRGGGASLYAAEHGLAGKVVAWFGLDPVDSQFGIASTFARTSLGTLAIPTAYFGAEVTSNCAPTADSYPMLYPKTPSPSVLIVGRGAGHTQLEPAAKCTICEVCSPAGTADPKVVLAMAVRYVTAFFARELLHDATVGPAFAGAGAGGDVGANRVTIQSK